MARMLVSAAAGLLLLAACGGGDDDAGDGGGGADDGRAQEYVAAVSASIQEDDDAPPIEAEQADCMASAVVDVVGVDTLTDAGISPEELGDADNLSSLDVEVPDDAADRLSEALGGCDLAGSLRDAVLQGFVGEFGTELPADAASCLSGNLDDQALADALARSFVDGSDVQIEEALLSAVAACPSVMTAVLVAEMPAGMPSSAEGCIGEFVEDNADLVARSFRSGTADAGRELGPPLVAACPELAAAVGGG